MGAKCSWKRGPWASQRLTRACLWVSVVVHDNVHVQRSGNVLTEPPQKVQIFLMPVALSAWREDPSLGGIQRRKQGGTSVAQVIVISATTM